MYKDATLTAPSRQQNSWMSVSLRNYSEFCSSFSAQELSPSLLLSETSPHGRWLCSGVRQGRKDWHWIAGNRSRLPFWTMGCTSVVCSFILPADFHNKVKHSGKWMLLVRWSPLGAGRVLQPSTTAAIPHSPWQRELWGWRYLPDHQFPKGRHRQYPRSDFGMLCRVHLRPPFSKLVLQRLVTLSGLNHWSTSRKSRNCCTVLVWCPWFGYILSKLPTFLF